MRRRAKILTSNLQRVGVEFVQPLQKSWLFRHLVYLERFGVGLKSPADQSFWDIRSCRKQWFCFSCWLNSFGLIPPLGVLRIVAIAGWLMGAIRCSKESLYLGLYCFAWRIKCLRSAINVYRFRVRSSGTLSVGFFLPVLVGFA